MTNLVIPQSIDFSEKVFFRIERDTLRRVGECLMLVAGRLRGDVLRFERVESLHNRSVSLRRFRTDVRDTRIAADSLQLPEVGIYHSHAQGIVPSAADLDCITRFPRWTWLIGCPLGATVHIGAYRKLFGRVHSISVSREEPCRD